MTFASTSPLAGKLNKSFGLQNASNLTLEVFMTILTRILSKISS